MAAVTFAMVVTAAVVVAKVSFWVGMTALALKVVGKVTGNKTLTKIGTYMGYAALVGGIGSLGVMGADTLIDMASGPIIEGAISGSSTAAGSLGSAATDPTIGAVTDGVTNAGTTAINPNAINPVWGNTLAAQQGLDLGAKVVADATAPVSNTGGLGYEIDPFGADSSPQPEAGAPVAAPPGAPGAPTSTGVQPPTVTGQPASVVPGQVTPSEGAPYSLNMRDPYGNFSPPRDGLFGPKLGVSPGGGEHGWWKDIDPSVKAMAGLGLAQTGAGAAQGWFAGQSAEEKLAFDKQVNAQRQTELERRIFNASNTPFVFRRNGMLQQGGA